MEASKWGSRGHPPRARSVGPWLPPGVSEGAKAEPYITARSAHRTGEKHWRIMAILPSNLTEWLNCKVGPRMKTQELSALLNRIKGLPEGETDRLADVVAAAGEDEQTKPRGGARSESPT